MVIKKLGNESLTPFDPRSGVGGRSQDASHSPPAPFVLEEAESAPKIAQTYSKSAQGSPRRPRTARRRAQDDPQTAREAPRGIGEARRDL